MNLKSKFSLIFRTRGSTSLSKQRTNNKQA
jgi:hypothetical protein